MILDIGGGILYDTELKDILGWTKYLPFKIIAELGRYFAGPSYHLAIQVTAKTQRGIFIDNGVYHDLNVYNRDHWKFPKLTHYYDIKNDSIVEIKEEICNYQCKNIFGPTCDSHDVISDCVIPINIEIGDWIFMDNMGAYTKAASVNFNGIISASSSDKDKEEEHE